MEMPQGYASNPALQLSNPQPRTYKTGPRYSSLSTPPMVNQTLPQVKFNRNQSALRAVNMI